MTNDERWPAWVQWAILIGFNLVMATLFGGLVWFMVWFGTTQGGW